MLTSIFGICFSAGEADISFAAETSATIPDISSETSSPKDNWASLSKTNESESKKTRETSENVEDEVRRFEVLSKLPITPYEFSKYFFFSKPYDEYRINVQSKPDGTLKPWSQEEKCAVESALDKILKSNPGLLRHLSTNGLVALNRRDQSDGQSTTASASTGPTYINVFDMAFTRNRTSESLERTLRHELIHVADSGHQISNSKSWSRYAGPLITPVRNSIRSNVFDCSKHPRGWEIIGKYGTTNLAESLAEFFADESYKTSADLDVRTALRAIFEPTPRELAFAAYCKSGLNHVFAGRAEFGIKELERALKLEPSSPVILYYLGWLNYKKKQLELARDYLSRAEAAYAERRVAHDELQYVHLLKLRLAIEEQLPGGCSISVMNELLFNFPNDGVALRHRAVYFERRREFGPAALDLYNRKSKTGILTFRVLPFDGEDTIESYNALLKRSDEYVRPQRLWNEQKVGLGAALQRRALFVENFGDIQTDTKQKNFLYQLALKDYQTSAKYHCSLVNALVGAGRVSVKLNKIADAKELVDDLRMLKQDAPATILTLLILDAEHDSQHAEKLFKKFKAKLLGPDFKERAPMSYSGTRLKRISNVSLPFLQKTLEH